MEKIRAVVLIVSDKGFAGEREDASGPILVKRLQQMGAKVVDQAIVPDERVDIERKLIGWADEAQVDLIITSGGTGPAPRDVTPEATSAVIEREMPGIAEALRFEGYRKTPLAVISRGIAGIRGQTLIVNLPGSPKAVREGMETLTPILPHAIRMLRGVNTSHEHGHEHDRGRLRHA